MNIYNLYPQLVGHISKWNDHLDRIANMNFEWVYLNPFHLPGYSGSSYSIKNYYLYHPLFTKGEYDYNNLEMEAEKGDALLKAFCEKAESKNLKIMMDIVINHTSFDSYLVENRPEWFEKDENGDFKKPGTIEDGHLIEWSDSFQIDNLSNNLEIRQKIWDYWFDYLMIYIYMGIKGFRCDAAYKVPTELWTYLIREIKKYHPDIIFVAETLGCVPEKLKELSDAGFDYVMNSMKWWNYKDHWFMMDYSKWMGQANSLTFPENHDTERFYAEHRSREKAVATYALQAYFSSSIATTIGFEYGFNRQINVVETNPMDWEEGNYDISDEISKINKIKQSYKILHEDSKVYIYEFYNDKVMGYIRESNDGTENIIVVANLSEKEGQTIEINNFHNLLRTNEILDLSHGHRMDFVPDNLHYYLQPNEVKLFYAKRGE